MKLIGTGPPLNRLGCPTVIFNFRNISYQINTRVSFDLSTMCLQKTLLNHQVQCKQSEPTKCHCQFLNDGHHLKEKKHNVESRVFQNQSYLGIK